MGTQRIVRWWGVAAMLALWAASAWAGSTQAFSFHAKSYPGSRDRDYKVYVPSGLSGPAPMVMALHGCEQTHDDVLRDWGLTAAADRQGFILVAPFITSWDGLRNTNCWGFWFDAHRHQGRGEPEDLHQIALEVESRFSVDPARRYITGLSSGAAMSVVAATTHNEYWAAAASASGLPYGEDSASVSFSCPGSATFHPVSRVLADMRAELDNDYAIPLMVLQNERDCTVLPAAARNLRDVQLKAFGDAAHDTPSEARAAQSACTPVSGSDDYGCKHVFYTVDGHSGSRSLVETVFYSGPVATPDATDTDHGHYWIGGASGRDGKWALQRGPSYPDIVWDFFSRHPRTGGAHGGLPQIALIGANPLQISVGQAFADPGATATDPEDGSLAVSADCSSVDPAHAGRYACTYRATDSASNTVTARRDVVVTDTTMSCATVTASPAVHLSTGRGVAGGWFSTRVLSNADRQDIGSSWNFWSGVMLHEGQPGRWYAHTPQGCES
jgi:poly(hydroxyalkanoate) depolymerase family esterase